MKAEAVSGETPKRELARILAAFERGEIDVLVNAMLLAEGWNSPRATVCMHLAPTASKRVYQQRVGRVTRRHPGKEAGIVVDFVHPATTHDEPIVTLHKLLDRDVYRGGAIVVGPVRRGRGRRLRVERRIVPVTSDPERRLRVFERELWRIAVEYLFPGRAARLGRAGRRARGRQRLAPREDDDPPRRRRRAAPPLPAQLHPAQPQRAAAPARARRDRGAPRPRGLRPRGRHHRHVVARGAPRGRAHPAAGARRAAHRPPRPGTGLAVAPGRVLARRARGVRGAALAGDEAAARAARQLVRARPTGATPAGWCTRRASTTAAWRRRCWRPRWRTRPRRRRCCAAPATGWRASRPRWRASWCATSPRASAAARSSATDAAATVPAREGEAGQGQGRTS